MAGEATEVLETGGKGSNGQPINSTGAGADPSQNVTLRALVSSKEGECPTTWVQQASMGADGV